MNIGIYAGAFKPPHKGHFAIAETASKQNDYVHIIISPSEREGITLNQSLKIWKIYAKQIPNLKISVANNSPVRFAYELVEQLNASPNASKLTIKVYCDKDDLERFSRLKEFTTNCKALYLVKTPRICSASQIRTDLQKNKLKAVLKNIPKQVDRNKVLSILTKSRM